MSVVEGVKEGFIFGSQRTGRFLLTSLSSCIDYARQLEGREF